MAPHDDQDPDLLIDQLYDRVRNATPEEREVILNEAARASPEQAAAAARVRAQFAGTGCDWLSRAEKALAEALIGNIFTSFNPPPMYENRYVIRALLGTGGFAETYRATDILLERTVAIKIERFPSSPAESDQSTLPENAENLDAMESEPSIPGVREGQRMAQAKAAGESSAILEVHDQQIDQHGRRYLVLEYADGGSLDRLILDRDNLPGARQLVQWLLPIAHALDAYYEKERTIHGDVKPANILLVKGHAKLADFGGGETPCFAAPPTYVRPDRRCDVYSLGMSLLALLAGGEAGSRAELLASLWKKQGVDRRLLRILEQATALDPDACYPAAKALAADLQRWHDRRPTSRDGPLAAAWLFVLRHPKLCSGMLLVIMLVAGLWLSAREENLERRIAVAIAQAGDGRWNDALPLFQEVINDERGTIVLRPLRSRDREFELRLRRLPGLLATNRIDEFENEIRDLEREKIGGWRKALAIYRLNLAAFHWELSDRHELATRDLAGEGKVVWSGDDDFAEALIHGSDDPRAARDRLKDALLKNPRHFGARQTLAMLLIFQGAFEEAREHLTFLEKTHPDARVIEFGHASLDALNGLPVGDIMLRTNAWPADFRDELQFYLTGLQDVQRLIAALHRRIGYPGWMHRENRMKADIDFTNSLYELAAKREALRNKQKIVFKQAAVPHFAFDPFDRVVESLVQHGTLVAAGRSEPAALRAGIEHMEETYRRHPDGTLLAFIKSLKFLQTYRELLHAGNPAAIAGHTLDALAREFEDIGKSRTFAAASPVRFRTLAMLAMLDIHRHQMVDAPDPHCRRRLLNTLREVALGARSWPVEEREILHVLLEALTSRPLETDWREWEKKFANPKEHWHARKQILLEGVRHLANHVDVTGSPNRDYVGAWRADAELWAGWKDPAGYMARPLVNSADAEAAELARGVLQKITRAGKAAP